MLGVSCLPQSRAQLDVFVEFARKLIRLEDTFEQEQDAVGCNIGKHLAGCVDRLAQCSSTQRLSCPADEENTCEKDQISTAKRKEKCKDTIRLIELWIASVVILLLWLVSLG